MNTFKNISDIDLVARLEKLVKTERKITQHILLHIAEIETRKVFADLGFDSMYAYLTRGLGYSDGAAYRRIQSARLLNQIPEIAVKLEEGTLNLSQLTQVQKCLKEESKQTGEMLSKEQTLELLTKLENQNSFETQKTLACEMKLPIFSQEKVRPQKDHSVRLELTLTKEQYEEIEQAKSLLSHICPDGNWSEIITTLAKQFNQKKLIGRANNKTQSKISTEFSEDKLPEIKAEHASESSNTRIDGSNLITKKNRRIYISVRYKRQLLERAQFCCEYKNEVTGQSCGSRYQLQVDHVQPLALGGSHDFKNLRILCRTHNTLAAHAAGLSRQAKGTQR